MKPLQIFGVLLLCTLSVPLSAQQTFHSAEQQATLLELYTSEGCSSCPPADRWFSSLLDHPQLWDRVVPVAFHVDYWNYLGWEDRFSRSSFARRQRQYREQGSTNGVYTPGVLAGGREWRSWRQTPQSIPVSGRSPGVLALQVDAGTFTARFHSASQRALDPLRLHVAVLGFELSSPVHAGENRGEVLRHDFVVLGHGVYAARGLVWQGELPAASYMEQARRHGIVAWVSTADRQEPLQAVGGWLER